VTIGTSGLVEIPLFPLPNLVLFPSTVAPLHIFEPRYRLMVREALEGDGRIGIVLLKPGWEKEYEETPAVYSVGGLGVISDHEELEDGKFNIMLTGLDRFQIESEVRQTPYRIARVLLLKDSLPDDAESESIQRKLLGHFQELAGDEQERIPMNRISELRVPELVNVISMSLEIPPQEKQLLLQADDVAQRADLVLEIMEQLVSRKRFLQEFDYLRPEDPQTN
jgi:uncharacterized protein